MRTLSGPERLAKRLEVVSLRDRGHSLGATAREAGLSRSTVVSICKRHKLHGTKGLHDAPRGRKRGECRLLSSQEETSLWQLISTQTPDQLGMPYTLWTRQAVCELVLTHLGIALAVRTTGLYLRRWGICPSKPPKSNAALTGDKSSSWFTERYPHIAQLAKTEGAEVHWCDVKDLLSPRSVEPCIGHVDGSLPMQPKHLSVQLLATVVNQGQMRWVICRSASFRAEVFIEFMRRLLETSKKKIFLILERVEAHQSEAVKHWLSENRQGIEIFLGPALCSTALVLKVSNG